MRKCYRSHRPMLRKPYRSTAVRDQARAAAGDGLEYGLYVGWRTADDAQDFRGRSLLLQRLGQLACALLDLLLQAGIGLLQMRRHLVELPRQGFELIPGCDRD